MKNKDVIVWIPLSESQYNGLVGKQILFFLERLGQRKWCLNNFTLAGGMAISPTLRGSQRIAENLLQKDKQPCP